ncbi:hypothetical protein PIROE2DRAFT_16647 [Piromyces sp. E2]|nr:hypothetical protein PIROE2DRAFT_16647 [Piromyces sp. E2]|eukprot:OUM58168.1 hypothetical protein PIROE2DRAFT_16647 [Piromyces sp. E2]
MLNSKNRIIKDTGFFKILLFSLGIILFFISVIFSTYTSYLECSMHFSIKHIGITLVLIIFYIYITLGHELGITGYLTDNDKKIYLVNSLSVDSFESIDSNISDIYNILSLNNSASSSINSLHSRENSEVNISKMKTDNELFSAKNTILKNNENVLNKQSKSLDKLNNIEERNGTNNINIYDNFRNKNKEYIEKRRMSLSYMINKALNKNDKGKMNKNKQNIHKNIKKAHSLFLEMVILYPLFILFTIILANAYFYVDNNEEKTIIQSKNGQWFYKCSLEKPDIAYNALEIMILVIILIKGKYVIMCNCVFKCTFYIYYSSIIAIALGPLINKCILHNSFTCGCKLEESDENLELIIKKYIIFYKFCSTIFIINHGKIKYINMKSKLSITKNDV